jgi:alkylation response protein AidB-like acyl-CoA dehydrogenase
MVADMATELECARLLTYRAAWMVQQGQRADTQASMAKYYASEAALRIASKAVQVHGALGLSRDLPVESYFRDARMISIPDGTSQLQQLIIARNVLGMAAFTDARPAA